LSVDLLNAELQLVSGQLDALDLGFLRAWMSVSRINPALIREPAMPIDIDQLSESELIALNHRVVARLRFLREIETHASMLEFRIGERVRFCPEGQLPVTGMITRYNKKTVSIVTDNGQRWNVAPQLLERSRSKVSASTLDMDMGNVIALPRADNPSR